ncbi:MAG: hypothetical protein LBS77_00475 [Desulfovibrio sp.]|jgi:hypothetical protein|nr:hypothetical protein [Desulfovibrio sp.]
MKTKNENLPAVVVNRQIDLNAKEMANALDIVTEKLVNKFNDCVSLLSEEQIPKTDGFTLEVGYTLLPTLKTARS